MRHSLCWLAALGVVAIPAAAAACWPRWGRQAVYNAPPVYSAPMYSYPPPVFVNPQVWQQQQPAQPQGFTLPPPRVEAGPRLATPVPAPAPGIGIETPTRPPVVEPLRPASGSDTPPKKIEPPPFPLDLSFPKVEIPKNLQLIPKAKEPDPVVVPKVPAVGAPKDPLLPAIPSAAPPPDSLIPSPSIPLVPDASKLSPLPSLTLPPDTPVAPPAKTDSTSRSSPISGTKSQRDLIVSVFPANREAKIAGVYRTVGFFNHTDRDLALTIEGRAVNLPAKSYLHAQLAATFTWGHAARPDARASVPDGAAGLDVVFRD